jgi:hypothetical protein
MELKISTLTKKFIIIISFFISLFIFLIFVHSKFNQIDYSTKISSIIKLPNLAFSNNIYESRFKEYKDFSNIIFSMNIQLSNQDFIYEK